MENYVKGESHAVYDPPSLSMDGAIEMKVTNGSKIRNLMGYAISSIAVCFYLIKYLISLFVNQILTYQLGILSVYYIEMFNNLEVKDMYYMTQYI